MPETTGICLYKPTKLAKSPAAENDMQLIFSELTVSPLIKEM